MIHILFTGGTISMRHDAVAGGNVPALGGEDLLEAVGGLEGLGPLRVEDWERLPAVHRGPELVWRLRTRIAELAGDDAVTGIVVPHGTDTLGETAYLVARTVPIGRPVVLTGAMRTSSDDEWDGPRNLSDAVRVAADPASGARGCMVVFHGRILEGHLAAKMHTSAIDAFGTPHGVPMGSVNEHGVVYAHPPCPCPVAAVRNGLTARVALLFLVLGDEGLMLDLARPHHDGLVVAGFGRGNVPPGAVPAIRRWLDEGKPVVLASRCPLGEVGPDYVFDGGGGQILRLGVLPAGRRTPAQARLELVIALSAGEPYGGVAGAGHS